MNKVKPISPSEVYQELPDYVIDGANACIRKHWVELNCESHFTQDELIDSILASYNKYNPGEDVNYGKFRRKLFDNHYLDIEPIYQNVGWIVTYDAPAYCESYPASFTFKKI